MQKCLLLAEGISSAGFPRYPITAELNKPARYRGVLTFSVTYREKAGEHDDRCNSPRQERLSRASSPAGETWILDRSEQHELRLPT